MDELFEQLVFCKPPYTEAQLKQLAADQTAFFCGQGSLGLVRKCGTADGLQIVAKTVIAGGSQKAQKRALLEAWTAQHIDHPLFPKYLGCRIYAAECKVQLFMEAVEGAVSLGEHVMAHGPLGEASVQQITHQLVEALHYLHSNLGLLHVDLKAENVLYKVHNDQIQLIDFDLCMPITTTITNTGSSGQVAAADGQAQHAPCRLPVQLWLRGAAHSDQATQAGAQDAEPFFWGSLEYVAPEVVQGGKSKNSPASDWWALGVLVYELLYGQTPFVGPNPERVVYNITMRAPSFPEEPQVSDVAKDFIRSLLRHKIEYRLGSKGVEEILGHCWLRKSAQP